MAQEKEKQAVVFERKKGFLRRGFERVMACYDGNMRLGNSLQECVIVVDGKKVRLNVTPAQFHAAYQEAQRTKQTLDLTPEGQKAIREAYANLPKKGLYGADLLQDAVKGPVRR